MQKKYLYLYVSQKKLFHFLRPNLKDIIAPIIDENSSKKKPSEEFFTYFAALQKDKIALKLFNYVVDVFTYDTTKDFFSLYHTILDQHPNLLYFSGKHLTFEDFYYLISLIYLIHINIKYELLETDSDLNLVNVEKEISNVGKFFISDSSDPIKDPNIKKFFDINDKDKDIPIFPPLFTLALYLNNSQDLSIKWYLIQIPKSISIITDNSPLHILNIHQAPQKKNVRESFKQLQTTASDVASTQIIAIKEKKGWTFDTYFPNLFYGHYLNTIDERINQDDPNQNLSWSNFEHILNNLYEDEEDDSIITHIVYKPGKAGHEQECIQERIKNRNSIVSDYFENYSDRLKQIIKEEIGINFSNEKTLSLIKEPIDWKIFKKFVEKHYDTKPLEEKKSKTLLKHEERLNKIKETNERSNRTSINLSESKEKVDRKKQNLLTVIEEKLIPTIQFIQSQWQNRINELESKVPLSSSEDVNENFKNEPYSKIKSQRLSNTLSQLLTKQFPFEDKKELERFKTIQNSFEEKGLVKVWNSENKKIALLFEGFLYKTFNTIYQDKDHWEKIIRDLAKKIKLSVNHSDWKDKKEFKHIITTWENLIEEVMIFQRKISGYFLNILMTMLWGINTDTHPLESDRFETPLSYNLVFIVLFFEEINKLDLFETCSDCYTQAIAAEWVATETGIDPDLHFLDDQFFSILNKIISTADNLQKQIASFEEFLKKNKSTGEPSILLQVGQAMIDEIKYMMNQFKSELNNK